MATQRRLASASSRKFIAPRNARSLAALQRYSEADRAYVAVTLRLQDGYDHGYHFIATFIEDHLRHHAAALARPG